MDGEKGSRGEQIAEEAGKGVGNRGRFEDMKTEGGNLEHNCSRDGGQTGERRVWRMGRVEEGTRMGRCSKVSIGVEKESSKPYVLSTRAAGSEILVPVAR